ncbi:peptidoglycan-binding domain-containing protein, partial [Caenispirillum bisanense]|uniref:peptidoglycan-binding domain-containing protein n=1 Tax=Caenispirillum bisanense TaxID=414052 RepID=UPI0031D92F09
MPAPAAAATREPVTSLAPAASAEVREAQTLLLELGLWEGEPDGIGDDAFRRAVQAFQRHIGRPASGDLDAETLGALRTRADAARTARRLDNARAEEAAEAAAAIAAAPELAARLTRRPEDGRADAARNLAPCRTAPTAACLLHEARETAKGISDVELRDWVLLDIAAGLTLEEGADALWPALRLTTDPRAVFGGLRRVAVAAAGAGRDDLALQLAALEEALPREALRTWTALADTLSRRAPPPAGAVARVEAAADRLLATVPAPDRRAALLALGRAA